MPLSDITRRSILQSIEEADRLGRGTFLSKYGYGKARTTWLLYAGQSYDSKAIIGVAHKYACPDDGPLIHNRLHGGAPIRQILDKFEFSYTDELHLALQQDAADDRNFDPKGVQDARQWINRTIAQRRGQKRFRDSLIDAYEGRCAITGCSILAVLEAAHIFPYMGPETNASVNGLLLRADIHTLFDSKLLAVDPEKKKIRIARCLKKSEYGCLVGNRLRKPRLPKFLPSKRALRKHFKECELEWNR